MILSDPALEGVCAVLFDEFHERSLDADEGLAFALDAQGVIREDLRIVLMSATLPGNLTQAFFSRPSLKVLGAHGLSTPAILAMSRASASRTRSPPQSARLSRRKTARSSPFSRALPKSPEPPSASVLLRRTSTSRPSMARLARRSRTKPSHPRRRGYARSSLQPTSPKARSPSRAYVS